jgi:hypothetical protein
MSKKRILLNSILLMALVLSLVPALVLAAPPPALPLQTPTPIVYVVIAIDTEADNAHPTDSYHTVFDVHNYLRPTEGGDGTTISGIMDEGFRTTHRDSSGNPFKVSWFMEMDNYINQGQFADGIPFDYLTLYDLMMDNWGEEVEGWGDEIAYHHHFMHWDESRWVRTKNLIGYDWHNEALDYMILDGGFFPTAFRSGWLWTNNQLQAWIEEWMPIDYSNMPDWPVYPSWMEAPTSWFPYHPSTSDYRVPGDMNHWIARCNEGPSQSTVDSAFAEAQSSGGPVIYCWFAHKREDMRGRIASAQSDLEAAAQEYGVPFEYATAKEAMQEVMGCTDTTPPVLSIAEGEGVYTITSDEELWGDHPYVAAKYVGVSGLVYTHTLATSVGTNVWEASLSAELTIITPPEPYEVVTATASSELDGHLASHAVDENPDTYWDSTPQEVPAWIQVDLGETQDVDELMIHFWDGDSREYTYYVEASTDGTNWAEIVSSNTVHGLITHEFDPAISMRYARVTVTANSGPNDYAHIREIALYGGAEPEPETFYLQQMGAAALDLCGNSTVIFRFEHEVPVSIEIAPAEETVTAGESVTYTATAEDAYGYTWDVTAETVFSIVESGHGGSWDGNVYTSHTAGEWTVRGSYYGYTDDAYLTVEVGELSDIVISPGTATIEAGEVQTYTAEAFDAYGNSLGDVTAETAFSIVESGHGGSWDGNVYTSHTVGEWTVRGSYEGHTDDAHLSVVELYTIYLPIIRK